jgi:hypothetical protein
MVQFDVWGANPVSASGFINVTSQGFIKFKQESNSTVDLRYWEHLR